MVRELNGLAFNENLIYPKRRCNSETNIIENLLVLEKKILIGLENSFFYDFSLAHASHLMGRKIKPTISALTGKIVK